MLKDDETIRHSLNILTIKMFYNLCSFCTFYAYGHLLRWVGVYFFTYSLIHLCKSESEKVFARFTDAGAALVWISKPKGVAASCKGTHSAFSWFSWS
jgi:hypothetical protein